MENVLNEFPLKIFQSLTDDRENQVDNVVFSPVTLISTLLLLLYGSRGSSSVQLARVLLLSSNSSSSQNTLDSTTASILHLSSLIVKLNGKHDINNTHSDRLVHSHSPHLVNVNVTNLLLTSHSLTILQDFQLLSQELFNFHTKSLQPSNNNNKLLGLIFSSLHDEVSHSHSLSHAGSGQLDKVHSWLQQIASSSQQMTFFSCLHLNLRFKHSFTPIGRRTFHRSPNNSSDVPSVAIENYLDTGYNEHLQSNVLRLPLNRHNLHMIIIAPDVDTDLKDVVNEFTQSRGIYSSLNENVTRKLVHVQMPFIDLTWSGSFKQSLVSHGIRGIFNSNQANLVNISPDDSTTNVGDILQSNRLCMDQSLSAPASSSDLSDSNAINQLIINRPFIFLISKIHNKLIKDVILMGTFSSPIQ